jgi:hypothetical protein
MNKYALIAFSTVLLLLVACAAPEAKLEAETAPLDVEQTAEPSVAEEPQPTPFPMANGIFTGAPQDFVLQPGELEVYAQADAGGETPNDAVLAGRADGEAYLEATGRISGYRMQFNRTRGEDTPSYVVNIVNTYETAEGALLVLSREWHADVWSLIDNGTLTQLPSIPGLAAEHLVWQDPNGAVGVEIAYRNLYILLTAPGDGGDAYAFLSELAVNHVNWIQAGEQ